MAEKPHFSTLLMKDPIAAEEVSDSDSFYLAKAGGAGKRDRRLTVEELAKVFDARVYTLHFGRNMPDREFSELLVIGKPTETSPDNPDEFIDFDTWKLHIKGKAFLKLFHAAQIHLEDESMLAMYGSPMVMLTEASRLQMHQNAHILMSDESKLQMHQNAHFILCNKKSMASYGYGGWRGLNGNFENSEPPALDELPFCGLSRIWKLRNVSHPAGSSQNILAVNRLSEESRKNADIMTRGDIFYFKSDSGQFPALLKWRESGAGIRTTFVFPGQTLALMLDSIIPEVPYDNIDVSFSSLSNLEDIAIASDVVGGQGQGIGTFDAPIQLVDSSYTPKCPVNLTVFYTLRDSLSSMQDSGNAKQLFVSGLDNLPAGSKIRFVSSTWSNPSFEMNPNLYLCQILQGSRLIGQQLRHNYGMGGMIPSIKGPAIVDMEIYDAPVSSGGIVKMTKQVFCLWKGAMDALTEHGNVNAISMDSVGVRKVVGNLDDRNAG